MQEEFLNFIKAEEMNKNPKPLKESLIVEVLKQIVQGDREITGLATDRKNGDVFIRLSFTKKE